MFSSTWKHVGLVSGGILLLGCTSPTTTTRQSSLLDYLSISDQTAPAAVAKVQLPLAVGVAFLPGGSVASQGVWKTGGRTEAVFITAQDEAQLAATVQARFSGKPWVGGVKVIPSFYLHERGGFPDMARVAALNRVDVMILVSLNQVQFTSPKWYSMANWTGLGAYTMRGDKNDTSTFIDAAVFDVASCSLLFRATGTSTAKGSATWAGREEKLRKQSVASLNQAVEDLCGHLDGAVAAFKRDVLKGRRKDVRLLDRDGIAVADPGYDPNKN
jgi:rhombotail lipoprotein